jgi:hypothetical protein
VTLPKDQNGASNRVCGPAALGEFAEFAECGQHAECGECGQHAGKNMRARRRRGGAGRLKRQLPRDTLRR